MPISSPPTSPRVNPLLCPAHSTPFLLFYSCRRTGCRNIVPSNPWGYSGAIKPVSTPKPTLPPFPQVTMTFRAPFNLLMNLQCAAAIEANLKRLPYRRYGKYRQEHLDHGPLPRFKPTKPLLHSFLGVNGHLKFTTINRRPRGGIPRVRPSQQLPPMKDHAEPQPQIPTPRAAGAPRLCPVPEGTLEGGRPGSRNWQIPHVACRRSTLKTGCRKGERSGLLTDRGPRGAEQNSEHVIQEYRELVSGLLEAGVTCSEEDWRMMQDKRPASGWRPARRGSEQRLAARGSDFPAAGLKGLEDQQYVQESPANEDSDFIAALAVSPSNSPSELTSISTSNQLEHQYNELDPESLKDERRISLDDWCSADDEIVSTTSLGPWGRSRSTRGTCQATGT